MGGGGNPWDIPPFNWYNKAVNETKTFLEFITKTSAITDANDLENVIDITGKGALYCFTFTLANYAYNELNLILKIIADNETKLWIGLNTINSDSSYTLPMPSFTYMPIATGEKFRPSSLYYNSYSSEYKEVSYGSLSSGIPSYFAFPLTFNNNLKIQVRALQASSNCSIHYVYDLFDE